MTTVMTATEIKAKLLAVLEDVADGAEVEITKHGRVIARLVPAGPHPARAGALAGVARSIAPEEGLFATGERRESSWPRSSSTATCCTGGQPSRTD